MKGVTPVEEDEVELKFDNGKSLYVSKGLLSAMSPVFERMFKSNFKEKNERCISICGKEYDAFLDMLLYLHPRIRKDLSGKRCLKSYFYLSYRSLTSFVFQYIGVFLKIRKTTCDILLSFTSVRQLIVTLLLYSIIIRQPMFIFDKMVAYVV